MGDISLRKTGVEEKRAKVHKESKLLLDYTRKAIARLTYLKRCVLEYQEEMKWFYWNEIEDYNCLYTRRISDGYTLTNNQL